MCFFPPCYITHCCIYRFVDRDIFMRFRGGGIGHKAMRDWDDFLQGAKADTSAQEDSEMRGDESDLEDEGDLEDLGMQEEGTDEEDSADEEEGANEEEGADNDGDDDADIGQDDDNDRVLADEGEELDDDLLAEEGYGAL
jgi:hypothetical protein